MRLDTDTLSRHVHVPGINGHRDFDDFWSGALDDVRHSWNLHPWRCDDVGAFDQLLYFFYCPFFFGVPRSPRWLGGCNYCWRSKKKKKKKKD